MTREERIRTLLKTRRFVADPMQSGDPGGAFRPESRLLLMPNTYHAGCPDECTTATCVSPYRELDRCLWTLKAKSRCVYWHIAERYLRSTLRQAVVARKGLVYTLARTKTREVKVNGEYLNIVKYVDTGEPVSSERVLCPAKLTTKKGDFYMAVLETWNAGVSKALVDLGVTWLAREANGELWLQMDIYSTAMREAA